MSQNVTCRLRASINGSPFTYPVKLESGEVTVDSRSPIRRKLSAVIGASITDPECDTFQAEMRAEYGITMPGQETFWIPVGTFVVTEATTASPGKVEITGEDRWRRIANARFLRPVSTSGQHVLAIKSLIEGADSRISCTDYSGKTSTHRTSVHERDRDKAVLDLAKAIGVDVYMNVLGNAEIRVPHVLSDTAVLTVAGGDGGTLIDVKEGIKQGNTYNAVVVEGENASGEVSVRAEAKVTSAKSKLLFGGAFAQRPRFFRSTMISTQAQAQATANSMLAKVTGVSKTVSIEAFPLAMLEGGDPILLEVEDGRLEKHIVDSFNIPLSLGKMTLSTRTPYEEPEGE
jgi:hypothetical protein